MVQRLCFILGLFLISSLGFAQTYSSQMRSFRDEYQSKTLENFPHSKQDFFPINYAYKIDASYKLVAKGKVLTLPTSGTKNKDYREYATLHFKVNGKKQKLTVYQPIPVMPMYKNHLFLLLKDLTAPTETYGGGRYLDLTIDDFKNGIVEIDFNKLYNPYCAFSEGWNCPIPPKNNHLKVRIEAGEKVPLQTEYDK